MDNAQLENKLPALKIGELAPDFTLPDLAGERHTLSDYRGKTVVVNFWSAECKWAKRADEEIIPLLPEWGDQVVYLAVASNANETVEELVQEAQARGIPLVLRDGEQQAAAQYSAEFTPHIFIIDHEGILRYQGAYDDVTFRQREPTVNYLQNALASLQTGEMPDPAEVPAYGCTIMFYAIG